MFFIFNDLQNKLPLIIITCVNFIFTFIKSIKNQYITQLY